MTVLNTNASYTEIQTALKVFQIKGFTLEVKLNATKVKLVAEIARLEALAVTEVPEVAEVPEVPEVAETAPELTAVAFNLMMGLRVDDQEISQAELNEYIKAQAVAVAIPPVAQDFSEYDKWSQENEEMLGTYDVPMLWVDSYEVLEEVSVDIAELIPVALKVVAPRDAITVSAESNPFAVAEMPVAVAEITSVDVPAPEDATMVFLVFLKAILVALNTILNTACALTQLAFHYASVLQVLYNKNLRNSNKETYGYS